MAPRGFRLFTGFQPAPIEPWSATAADPCNNVAHAANPEQPFPHAYLAAAYGLKGEYTRAATELAQARELSSDDRYSSIAAEFAGRGTLRRA